jgi:DNA-directed RNA polymerase specialized sigma24 family protein
MCFLEERPQVEVAHELGVKVPAIKARIHRGKRMLKRTIYQRIGEYAYRDSQTPH